MSFASSRSPLDYSEGNYGTVDFNADMSKNIWTLRFYVKNLTNEHGRTYVIAVPNVITHAAAEVRSVPLQPRTIGVEFDVKL